MLLHEGLGVQRGDMVAFVGAGGKTSTLTRLGHELRTQLGWRVLATTTTRIGKAELKRFPFAIALTDVETSQGLSAYLQEYGFVFLYSHEENDKIIGIDPEVISSLVDRLDSDAILIEADGARRRPLKAPYSHEPVIPTEASLVVVVAGLDAIGQPFDEETVYNLQKISEIYGFVENTPIQPAWVAQTLRHPDLGLKDVPPRARVVALLNKVERHAIYRKQARTIAQQILQEKRIQNVAIGRVKSRRNPIKEVQSRVGAIILAGGLSSRMGQSKPLLPWGEKTVIETIVERLTPFEFADLLVVTGYRHVDVEAAIKNTAARPVFNDRYASGEMLSSFKTGLQALDSSIGACLIFLGDQPQISPKLVHRILQGYATGRGFIVAPSHMNRRGHPILIDRRHWRELLDLSDGKAPRDVINRYNDEIAYILTDDANILNDMDTPEEYRAALKRAGLL